MLGQKNATTPRDFSAYTPDAADMQRVKITNFILKPADFNAPSSKIEYIYEFYIHNQHQYILKISRSYPSRRVRVIINDQLIETRDFDPNVAFKLNFTGQNFAVSVKQTVSDGFDVEVLESAKARVQQNHSRDRINSMSGKPPLVPMLKSDEGMRLGPLAQQRPKIPNNLVRGLSPVQQAPASPSTAIFMRGQSPQQQTFRPGQGIGAPTVEIPSPQLKSVQNQPRPAELQSPQILQNQKGQSVQNQIPQFVNNQTPQSVVNQIPQFLENSTPFYKPLLMTKEAPQKISSPVSTAIMSTTIQDSPASLGHSGGSPLNAFESMLGEPEVERSKADSAPDNQLGIPTPISEMNPRTCSDPEPSSVGQSYKTYTAGLSNINFAPISPTKGSRPPGLITSRSRLFSPQPYSRTVLESETYGEATRDPEEPDSPVGPVPFLAKKTGHKYDSDWILGDGAFKFAKITARHDGSTTIGNS